MNIECFLVTNGKFEKAVMPKELLVELAENLRTKGNEMVFFAKKSIEVEGIYIPAKGSTTRLMAFQDED
jgi:hypothetical protein